MAKFFKTKKGRLKKREDLTGSILVILAGVTWGTTGLFVRYFTDLELGSLQVTVFRIVFAAIILVLYCAIFNRKALYVKLKDIWIFALSGIVSLDVFSVCYFATIERVQLSVAAVLLYFSPVIVLIISAILFKEKLTKKKIIACIMAFVGCVFVSGLIGSGTTIPTSALLLGLLSAFGYAMYGIFGELAIRRGYSSLTITTYTYIFGLAGVPFFVDFDNISQAASRANLAVFVIMAISISLVASLLASLLYMKGLETVSPSKASIMASMEPITATILSVFVLGESIDVYGILGVVFVVGAIILLNAKKIRKKIKEN